MKNTRIFLIVICLVFSMLTLCACPGGDPVSTTNPNSYDDKNSTKITFSQNDVNIKGVGASASGTDLRIGAQGTYVLSGETSNGSIVIDAGKADIRLVLEGISITNTDGPAVYVKNANKVTFTIVEGTNNVLSDGNAYQIKDINTFVDGTIFAKSDLVFNGTGTLTVNGNNAHGIVSKDDLAIENGNINVNSKNAGICGKDSIEIANANININAGTDGLKSDNITEATKGYITIQSGTFNITCGNDAIQAFNVAKIEGGSFNIKTTSEDPMSSAKGIKSTTCVEILGGNFVIDSIDDSVHSDGNVSILGGDLFISSLDDGIHANNELSIANGNVTINKSYEGLEATSIKISGGRVEINSTDDGMNSAGGNDQSSGDDAFGGTNGSVSILGGYTIIHSDADGIDLLGNFDMSAGVLIIDGTSKAKSGAIDFGSSSSITGGVIVALGVSNSAKNFTNATQGAILTKSTINYDADTVYSLCDENGNVIVAFKSTKTFKGMLISAPELTEGSTYTIYKNANVLGLDENGFAHNTTQSGGESCGTITLDSLIIG